MLPAHDDVLLVQQYGQSAGGAVVGVQGVVAGATVLAPRVGHEAIVAEAVGALGADEVVGVVVVTVGFRALLAEDYLQWTQVLLNEQTFVTGILSIFYIAANVGVAKMFDSFQKIF